MTNFWGTVQAGTPPGKPAGWYTVVPTAGAPISMIGWSIKGTTFTPGQQVDIITCGNEQTQMMGLSEDIGFIELNLNTGSAFLQNSEGKAAAIASSPFNASMAYLLNKAGRYFNRFCPARVVTVNALSLTVEEKYTGHTKTLPVSSDLSPSDFLVNENVLISKTPKSETIIGWWQVKQVGRYWLAGIADDMQFYVLEFALNGTILNTYAGDYAVNAPGGYHVGMALDLSHFVIMPAQFNYTFIDRMQTLGFRTGSKTCYEKMTYMSVDRWQLNTMVDFLPVAPNMEPIAGFSNQWFPWALEVLEINTDTPMGTTFDPDTYGHVFPQNKLVVNRDNEILYHDLYNENIQNVTRGDPPVYCGIQALSWGFDYERNELWGQSGFDFFIYDPDTLAFIRKDVDTAMKPYDFFRHRTYVKNGRRWNTQAGCNNFSIPEPTIPACPTGGSWLYKAVLPHASYW